MKKLLLVIVGVVTLSSLALAQVAGPTGGGVQPPQNQEGKKAGHRALVGKKMLKELGLTPEQQTKVKALTEKFKAEAGKEGASADRKAMRARRESFMKELNAILTPDQQKKLKELMSKSKDKKGSGSKDGSGL